MQLGGLNGCGALILGALLVLCRGQDVKGLGAQGEEGEKGKGCRPRIGLGEATATLIVFYQTLSAPHTDNTVLCVVFP